MQHNNSFDAILMKPNFEDTALMQHLKQIVFAHLLVNKVAVSNFDPSFDKTHHVLILLEQTKTLTENLRAFLKKRTWL